MHFFEEAQLFGSEFDFLEIVSVVFLVFVDSALIVEQLVVVDVLLAAQLLDVLAQVVVVHLGEVPVELSQVDLLLVAEAALDHVLDALPEEGRQGSRVGREDLHLGLDLAHQVNLARLPEVELGLAVVVPIPGQHEVGLARPLDEDWSLEEVVFEDEQAHVLSVAQLAQQGQLLVLQKVEHSLGAELLADDFLEHLYLLIRLELLLVSVLAFPLGHDSIGIHVFHQLAAHPHVAQQKRLLLDILK